MTLSVHTHTDIDAMTTCNSGQSKQQELFRQIFRHQTSRNLMHRSVMKENINHSKV